MNDLTAASLREALKTVNKKSLQVSTSACVEAQRRPAFPEFEFAAGEH
jgi:hypothetical protein